MILFPRSPGLKNILNWSEEAILSGSLATGSEDNFGDSVAMNSTGDRVVVGAVADERTGTTGEGLAYIFVSGTGGWTQQHILSGTLAASLGDNFGTSVAINSTGDRVIVGAQADERTSGATDVGLAYVFVSGTGGWTQQHILSGTLATSSFDSFGDSVAMNSTGDRVVVGAWADERISGANASGLAYVFVSGTGGWTQQHILSGTLATGSADNFGISVAMNSIGDRVLVGAYQDERASGASGEGLAYVFVSGTGGWTQQQILSGTLATDSVDFFGYSVAMNSIGDRVLVGAYSDERSGGSSSEGLAYIFVSGAGGWTEQQILSGTLATGSNDGFGYSVAMNSIGDRVLVGAIADERIGGASDVGLVYVFVSGTSGWTQQQILSGTLATGSVDFFGISVAMNSTGERIIIGASIDERESQIPTHNEGLAYVYKTNI